MDLTKRRWGRCYRPWRRLEGVQQILILNFRHGFFWLTQGALRIASHRFQGNGGADPFRPDPHDHLQSHRAMITAELGVGDLVASSRKIQGEMVIELIRTPADHAISSCRKPKGPKVMFLEGDTPAIQPFLAQVCQGPLVLAFRIPCSRAAG